MDDKDLDGKTIIGTSTGTVSSDTVAPEGAYALDEVNELKQKIKDLEEQLQKKDSN